MCGIYGYIGPRNGVKIAIDGLKRLEYRGYDSAGIGCIVDNGIDCVKEVGKIGVLEAVVDGLTSHAVIAHTRWATHGKVTRENAHPHLDETGAVAVVHNGIIENYTELRNKLKEEGVHFHTETDTEVIAQLIARIYEGNFLRAVQQAVLLLHGSYAIAVLHKNHPDQIVTAAAGCPLVIGVGAHETFLSSDPNALAHHTREVIYLEDGEVALIKADETQVFDATQAQISKKTDALLHDIGTVSKGDFQHFTLKEIFEQAQTVKNALFSRASEEYGTVAFEELHLTANELLTIKRVLIIACGTSWHAGYVAKYLLEDVARIPTDVEISSEFRYKNPIVEGGTLVIAISQSGETADTIAAVREVKAKGAYVVALCNVQGSTLAREAASCLFLRAGPEIGVCSTKAFTSQLVVLTLFTLLMARLRHMSKNEGHSFLHAMHELPDQIDEILGHADAIHTIAKKYSQYNDFFFLGRRYMYPTSLEGALKLKEIAYVNANGYPAGELKHGPIALINETCPTIALAGDKVTYDKLLSNLMEVKARHGKIIAITDAGHGALKDIADDIIVIPKTLDELAPITYSVACQLFAYFVALERGAEIDKPRNLAKSVTVE